MPQMNPNPYAIPGLGRNDVPAAAAYLKRWVAAGFDPESQPFKDALTILFRLQDETATLEKEVAKILPPPPAGY